MTCLRARAGVITCRRNRADAPREHVPPSTRVRWAAAASWAVLRWGQASRAPAASGPPPCSASRAVSAEGFVRKCEGRLQRSCPAVAASAAAQLLSSPPARRRRPRGNAGLSLPSGDSANSGRPPGFHCRFQGTRAPQGLPLPERLPPRACGPCCAEGPPGLQDRGLACGYLHAQRLWDLAGADPRLPGFMGSSRTNLI